MVRYEPEVHSGTLPGRYGPVDVGGSTHVPSAGQSGQTRGHRGDAGARPPRRGGDALRMGRPHPPGPGHPVAAGRGVHSRVRQLRLSRQRRRRVGRSRPRVPLHAGGRRARRHDERRPPHGGRGRRRVLERRLRGHVPADEPGARLLPRPGALPLPRPGGRRSQLERRRARQQHAHRLVRGRPGDVLRRGAHIAPPAVRAALLERRAGAARSDPLDGRRPDAAGRPGPPRSGHAVEAGRRVGPGDGQLRLPRQRPR